MRFASDPRRGFQGALPIGRPLLALLLLPLGCSVYVDGNRSQCGHDDQCRAVGDVCVDGLCQPLEALSRWGCSGRVSRSRWPVNPETTLSYDYPFRPFAPRGGAVRACARGDLECAEPVAGPLPLDSQGQVRFSLDNSFVRVDAEMDGVGALVVHSTDALGWFADMGLIYWSLPAVAEQFGVEIDPEHAQLVLDVNSCDDALGGLGRSGEDATVHIEPPAGRIFYLTTGGNIDERLNETAALGAALILDVPQGEYTVRVDSQDGPSRSSR